MTVAELIVELERIAPLRAPGRFFLGRLFAVALVADARKENDFSRRRGKPGSCWTALMRPEGKDRRHGSPRARTLSSRAWQPENWKTGRCPRTSNNKPVPYPLCAAVTQISTRRILSIEEINETLKAGIVCFSPHHVRRRGNGISVWSRPDFCPDGAFG